MKQICRVLILMLALAGGSAVFASEADLDGLAAIQPLVGDWTGVGEGDPGTSAAARHAERAQDGRYIMVAGRSVYPKQDKNPKGEVHTSLDVWSFDKARRLIVMRQFDNLGFVSTYVQDRAASREGHVVMVSESMENVPAGWRARYTYDFIGADEYRELFELDPDGKGFQTYVTGRYLRDRP
ncbi:hypothetical protein QO010_000514 [Caulobacter ginsengisoli]|uniref:THAP4-like heme-binding beta-barrel domain-containing protein n=1 Tax=Caulobacter ginsengisoli TaxID=400775 RepID=A0ABU0IMZ9_9CAUL|nr:hypothetical protein [Caulobacter ginsengisoli]MDQ0462766.1 hypothetical protein [Caulobacter ginsengisoli]